MFSSTTTRFVYPVAPDFQRRCADLEGRYSPVDNTARRTLAYARTHASARGCRSQQSTSTSVPRRLASRRGQTGASAKAQQAAHVSDLTRRARAPGRARTRPGRRRQVEGSAASSAVGSAAVPERADARRRRARPPPRRAGRMRDAGGRDRLLDGLLAPSHPLLPVRSQTIHGFRRSDGTPPPRGVGGGVMSSLQRLQRVCCGQVHPSARARSTIDGCAYADRRGRDEHE